MISKLKDMIVTKNTGIKEILLKINKNGKNGVFVISKSKSLLGVITDSDIRKSLLRGELSFKKKAKDIYQKNYYSIPHTKEKLKKKILLESNKILIPILKRNKLTNFIHTSDLIENKRERGRKILVIGGLGYIGSVLVQDLIKKKYQVNILDTNYYGCYLDKKILKNKNLKVFYGNCENKVKLKKSLKNCTDVIHLGEIVGDPAVNINENFSIKNNYENTVFVISECIKNKINKFIFASSCSVYGDSKLKCSENSKLNPVSLYAKCKIECEKSILSFKSDGFCPVILRLSTVYGDSPRKRFDLVVNRFVLMALKKIKIQLYGENSWRPFISTNDVSRLLIKVLETEKKKVSKQIFNAGSDKENYRIIDIVKIIKKYMKIDYEKSKIDQDKRNYKVSFRKINKKLNFNLKDNLKKTIFKLIRKYKKMKINEKNINYYNDKKIHKILKKNPRHLNYI